MPPVGLEPKQDQLRTLLPSSSASSIRPPMVAKATRKPRAKNACVSCKQLKAKCSEETPRCANCRDNEVVCVYNIEETPGYRREVIRNRLRQNQSEIDKYKSILDYIKNASLPALHRVLEALKGPASIEEILLLISQGVDSILPTEVDSSIPQFETPSGTDSVNQAPEVDLATTDTRFLANSWNPSLVDRPIDSDAVHGQQPWTSVPNETELVSHLISSYMTLHHPTWNLLEYDTLQAGRKPNDIQYHPPIFMNTVFADAHNWIPIGISPYYQLEYIQPYQFLHA
ncbi:hypothetical protein H072_6048 [Dactylellina haptotyla CBS 200.50]|uniref:Zn(2)-C6 fungal-type domain-containing protein n=1 Tax=Dactylellina haptotyla (strain CBS 200.50) TaxID=1284197 RepID=S8AG67_DACHA|nr:hypothetical protein H072_6048 [Dactylellina haptotyla CBS 200.50]